MKPITRTTFQSATFITILADVSALAFIYLVPSVSHLINMPLYLIEPMRLMLILAMVHTNHKNAYILALTMPLFSLIISGHPALPKMILIAIELSLNVFLFYALAKYMKNFFSAILISIIASKIIYYLLKFILINLAVINTGLISTPILIQIITTVVFSLYLFKFYKAKETN